ncbi:MAG: MFS transporter [Puniceicoccaceae bacterium]
MSTNANDVYLRKNYVLSSLEGGFFMGGMSFLSMESVMPAMVHDLGGPGWAVSVSPVLFILGFCWPQIISALWAERMRLMLPMVKIVGLIQRLPYLLTGLFLVLAGENHQELSVTLAILTPFIMSSLGGLQGAAYFETITRIVPIRRTASMWAIRNIIMAVMGILAGFIIKGILEVYPGVHGYGILHLIVFGLMMFSLGLICLIKETNVPAAQKPDPVTLQTGFAAFKKQWQETPSLGRFIISRFLFMLIFVVIPFLSIRAIERTGQATSFVGLLVICQMLGFIAGNVLSGLMGDRKGVRLPMLVGRVVVLLALFLVIPAEAPWTFMVVFFCLGFGLSTGQVGDMTMVIDFAPSYRRKFFYGVMGTLVIPGILSASIISAILQYVPHGFHYACLASGLGLAASLAILLKLRDPRLHREIGALPQR